MAFGILEVPAAPGGLDPTFGNEGIVITSGNDLGGATAMAIQSDGKILVVCSGGFGLVRYNTDGSLDNSFAKNGIVKTPLGYVYEEANSVAVQGDGKIVVAGSVGNGFNADFAVVRYNSFGSLDTTFNGTGVVITSIGGTDYGNSVAIQTDGKIVLTGSSTNYMGTYEDFAVVRYNTNGSLDTTFNGTGKVVTPVALYDFARAVSIQADGKIVAAGRVSDGTSLRSAVVRYNINGTLDTTFNGTGMVVGEQYSGADSLALQPDGKIVTVGFGNDEQTQTPGLAVVRRNPNGSLDTAFGGTGRVIIVTSSDSVNSVAIQSDGKIVTAGYSQNGGTDSDDFLVLRFNPNGSLDTVFNGTGRVATSISSGNDWGSAVAIQADGRIVTAGTSYTNPSAIALVRYQGRSGTRFDYDGDGKTDFSVYTRRRGWDEWYVAESGSGQMRSVLYGPIGDGVTPVPADYDGDGKTDIAHVACCWSDVGDPDLTYFWSLPGGLAGAMGSYPGIPRSADYDGDGKADKALWYPTDGTWLIDLSNSWEYRTQWGLPGDKPVPDDYDGDGKADLAVWRPSDGKWYIASIATGQITVISWGLDGDIPVPGDYNGDGRADFAVYRPSNNTWHRMHSNDYSMHETRWGLPGDIVTPGDYDGDGKLDLAVWRPSNGTWYVLTAANTIYIQAFGLNGDIPTPSAFVY